MLFTQMWGTRVGILPFSKVQMEVGIDIMGVGAFPVLFNTKAAIPEDAFFKDSRRSPRGYSMWARKRTSPILI